MRSSSVSRVALILALTQDVSAFWRMPCRSRSGLARIDPLVSPGEESSHAHAIHGSSAFSFDSTTTDDLLAGDCTSCQVAEDQSAYWTPPLYFQPAGTDSFELVQQVGGMLAYYLLYPNPGETIVEPFPKDFYMIAGDDYQRNFTYPVPDIPKSNWNANPYNTQSFLRQAALGFNCLNYAATPEGSLFRHFLPNKTYLDANCLDGVRFELMFPSCWNGSIGSSDHKSHVAYPSEVMTGDCPPEYPKRLVSLFYETIWDTYAFAGRDGQFVIANGDPTGYGYHGDFMMGWNETFLRDAVNTCTNLSGQIEDCPLFTIQDSSVYSNCNLTEPISLVKENVVNPIGLPGNVPVISGPGYAKATASASAAPPEKAIHTVGSAASTSQKPGVVLAASQPAGSTLTRAPPPPSATSSVSYYSTQYLTTGQVAYEVLYIEEVVTVTEQITTTVNMQPRDHLHMHRHKRHNQLD